MLTKIAIALILLALTVLVHAAGLALTMRRLRVIGGAAGELFLPRTWLLIRLAAWVITIHIIEIAGWALFYRWQQCFPDLESALYFSVVTYTTVGYGDLTLVKEWRLLSGVEALTGILMCGWSTGFFFAVVSRIYTPSTGAEK